MQLVLLRLTDVLRHMIMETKGRLHLSLELGHSDGPAVTNDMSNPLL